VVAAADGFSRSRGRPQMSSRLYRGGGVDMRRLNKTKRDRRNQSHKLRTCTRDINWAAA
jgi:hypothetical protein